MTKIIIHRRELWSEWDFDIFYPIVVPTQLNSHPNHTNQIPLTATHSGHCLQESELASVLADPDADENWQEVADARDLVALLLEEDELKNKLRAALEKAQRADEEIDVATAPKAYKEAIESFSASISACVGEGLLPETAYVAVTARKLEATMRMKLKTAIDNAKQILRKAISTAVVTRESPPLAACLDKLVNTDQLLRESCDDVVQIAENLLKELREEEAKKAAAVKALKHSDDLAEKALASAPGAIFESIGRVFPKPIEEHLAHALFVEVKEDHPEVVRAKSMIEKMKEVLKSIEEARLRLAEATVTADKTREIPPLDSALENSLSAGVPHHCKEVVDARALLATLLAEADADAQKRLLEQLHQRLQEVRMHQIFTCIFLYSMLCSYGMYVFFFFLFVVNGVLAYLL